MNEVVKNMVSRRSVRSYTEKMVEEDVLREILQAASYAPSGMGRQPVRMVVVRDKQVRDQLSRMNAAIMGTADSDPFYGAPLVVVVLADRSSPTYLYDGSLAMGNLMNAAHALGVDSCWIHRAREEFESEEGKALLNAWGLDGNYEGIGHCILGYREGEYPDAAERGKDRIVFVG